MTRVSGTACRSGTMYLHSRVHDQSARRILSRHVLHATPRTLSWLRTPPGQRGERSGRSCNTTTQLFLGIRTVTTEQSGNNGTVRQQGLPGLSLLPPDTRPQFAFSDAKSSKKLDHSIAPHSSPSGGRAQTDEKSAFNALPHIASPQIDLTPRADPHFRSGLHPRLGPA